MQLRLHSRAVGSPFTASWSHVESISVGVDIDALQLTEDNATDEPRQFRVVLAECHIRKHLSTTVAQPHGVNVARINKGILIAVEMDSSVQRIRQTILEHPCQPAVGENFLDNFYLGLNSLRNKQPFFHRWTASDIAAFRLCLRRKSE